MGLDEPVSDSLQRQFARRPWLAFLCGIAIVGGLSAYDVVRLSHARDLMPHRSWLVAVAVGTCLVAVLSAVVVAVVRLGGGCVAGGLAGLPWLVAFSVSHPRYGSSALDHPWEVSAVVLADLSMVLGLAFLLGRAVARGRLFRPMPLRTPVIGPDVGDPANPVGETVVKPKSPVSWSDRFDQWARSVRTNLSLLFFLIVGSTVLLGVPVGVFSDAGFGNGLVIGAILPICCYGLLIVLLNVLSLVALTLEIGARLAGRLARAVAGRAPEQR